MQRLRLVIPVYNERTSFHSLFREQENVAAELPAREVNVGHQRAIAIGMATAAEDNFDAVLAMDADDEDSSQALAKLLAIAGSRQVLGVIPSSILLLLNSRVQRLIVSLVDYKRFVDFREQILNSVKKRSPVFEPALISLWEKLA
jgi:hypothetical protein